MPVGPAMVQAPGSTMWGPQPMRPNPFVRGGHILNMVGMLLVGIGAIVGAFALGGISVTNFVSTGSYPNYGLTFSAGSGAFTACLLLIGVGIILRAFGTLFASWWK